MSFSTASQRIMAFYAAFMHLWRGQEPQSGNGTGSTACQAGRASLFGILRQVQRKRCFCSFSFGNLTSPVAFVISPCLCHLPFFSFSFFLFFSVFLFFWGGDFWTKPNRGVDKSSRRDGSHLRRTRSLIMGEHLGPVHRCAAQWMWQRWLDLTCGQLGSTNFGGFSTLARWRCGSLAIPSRRWHVETALVGHGIKILKLWDMSLTSCETLWDLGFGCFGFEVCIISGIIGFGGRSSQHRFCNSRVDENSSFLLPVPPRPANWWLRCVEDLICFNVHCFDSSMILV